MISSPCIDRCFTCKGEHHFRHIRDEDYGCIHCALIVKECPSCEGHGLGEMRVDGYNEILESPCAWCGGLGLVAA